ncbi:unnamed protein product [Ectocarpus sp. 12 AP-2014]
MLISKDQSLVIAGSCCIRDCHFMSRTFFLLTYPNYFRTPDGVSPLCSCGACPQFFAREGCVYSILALYKMWSYFTPRGAFACTIGHPFGHVCESLLTSEDGTF